MAETAETGVGRLKVQSKQRPRHSDARDLRPHYHTITHTKTVTVPVKTPIPAPPAQVVNKVVNVPIHDSWLCKVALFDLLLMDP